MTDTVSPAPLDGRQRLIDAALRLFSERGFASVTVRDIAAACSVSVGLINHHFGSKEGLRDAVDGAFMAQFEEALRAAPALDAEGGGEIESWVDTWIARHKGDWPVTVAYFRRALLDDSDWGARLFTRFYRIAETTVTRMDADGVLRDDVDRLWLPFLIVFLELGTTLLDPHITRVLGKSGFDETLWRRHHRAYLSLIRHGATKAG